MKVIPGINCFDENCAKDVLPKLQVLKNNGVDLVHIDISDGRFTPRENPLGYSYYDSAFGDGLGFEVHLMVENPEKYIEEWSASKNVRRFIVHVESRFDAARIEEICGKKGVELEFAAGLIGGAEKLSVIAGEFLKRVQFLAVSPGPSGQKMDVSVLGIVRNFRRSHPESLIFVDGGINLETAAELKKAGADGVVSTSFLWKSTDVLEAYRALSGV